MLSSWGLFDMTIVQQIYPLCNFLYRNNFVVALINMWVMISHKITDE